MVANVIVLDFAVGFVLALGCAAVAAVLAGVARFAEWRARKAGERR